MAPTAANENQAIRKHVFAVFDCNCHLSHLYLKYQLYLFSPQHILDIKLPPIVLTKSISWTYIITNLILLNWFGDKSDSKTTCKLQWLVNSKTLIDPDDLFPFHLKSYHPLDTASRERLRSLPHYSERQKGKKDRKKQEKTQTGNTNIVLLSQD